MFDRIVCLCVDKRVNEQPRLKAEFDAAGLPLDFFVAGDGKTLPAEQYSHIDVPAPEGRFGYPAWVNRPNSYNAFLCYKKIIQKALDDGCSAVALVEDDCTLRPNFNEILPLALAELKELPPWDMFYLCANHAYTHTIQLKPHVLRLQGSGGFQFVNIRRNMFQVFLDMPMIAPIDGMAGNTLHSRYNCYAVWPNLAIPKPGYSHCEGTSYDNTAQYDIKGC